MRFSKLVSVIAAVACFTSTAAFAAPKISNPVETTATQDLNETKDKKDFENDKQPELRKECKDREDFSKDPVKMLEKRKEQVQSLYREGKITKEQADEIIRKLDSKINEINEFNKLPVKQKKEKLINDFKARIEKKVEEGKITKDEANKLMEEFTKKVEQWDGNGYPRFHDKKMKHGKNPAKDLEKNEKSNIQ